MLACHSRRSFGSRLTISVAVLRAAATSGDIAASSALPRIVDLLVLLNLVAPIDESNIDKQSDRNKQRQCVFQCWVYSALLYDGMCNIVAPSLLLWVTERFPVSDPKK